MKQTLASGSGYLEIDHRDSPGLRPEDVAHVPGTIAVPGGQHLERDIQQCSHCQRGVVLNPARVRDRAVCQKCYHYICDACETIRVKTGACVPFTAVIERVATIAEKFTTQPDHPDAVIDVATLSEPSAPRIVLTDGPTGAPRAIGST